MPISAGESSMSINCRTSRTSRFSHMKNYVPIRESYESHFIPSYIEINISNLLPRSHFLNSCLSDEHNFYVDTSSLISMNFNSEENIDASTRDDALLHLRSLHRAYYDLSPLTFCKSVCLLDTFITTVKVKPKYIMCVAAACYYIASKFDNSKQPQPTFDSLVNLFHCGGNTGDLIRMVDIILNKLGSSRITAIGASSGSALHFLALFLSTDWSSESFPALSSIPTCLLRQLEAALCKTNSSYFRPSCLALALLSTHKQNLQICEFCETIETGVSSFENLNHIRLSDLFNMANFCKVSWADVDACSHTLSEDGVITSYSYSPSGTSPIDICHQMTWNLSKRTQQSISGSTPPSLNTIDE